MEAAKVAQWMTKSVLTIKPRESLRHARERLAKYRINQLPVVVDDKLVGIVTDRDVRDAYPSSLRLFHGKDIDEFGDSHTVEEVMTYNVVTVTPNTSIREAARLLRQQRFGALPVVEEGKLVGIITRSDLLDAMLAGKSAEK
ncbi:MAG TPA: CBS domain-containing protein [Methylomirabilota bacterium]|jgi:acetoin utilization protein AcuB|nr:CBS domain-containing protein [Methylomirabilota bacterium]